jgi:hypothetical protein
MAKPLTVLEQARKVIVEFADKYNFETDDEMGITWCRFCSGFEEGSPTHDEDCILLIAKSLRNDREFAKAVRVTPKV